MRFTNGTDWWQYTGGHLYALGTSLMYRRDWWMRHPFVEINVGEDNQFVGKARAQNQLVVADSGDLMIASNHSGNTSPRNIAGKSWRAIERPASAPEEWLCRA